jgi:hypothetical protein
MDKFELEKRTKLFALKIIAFAATLPQSKAGGIIEYQLVKAGTSVRRWLLQESGELLAIFSSIGRSTKANRFRGRQASNNL